MRRFTLLRWLSALPAFLVLAATAQANSVSPGTFTVAITPLTLFLPGISVSVTVTGTQVINLPTGGTAPDVIQIEIVSMSLQGTTPVQINSSFFDLTLDLFPSTVSGGAGTVNPDGTLTSFFDVFFQVTLTPTGGGPPVVAGQPVLVSLGGILAQDPTQPPPNNHYWQLLCVTRAGRQDAIRCNVLPPPPPPPKPVPEPATLLLLGTGLTGVWFGRRGKAH